MPRMHIDYDEALSAEERSTYHQPRLLAQGEFFADVHPVAHRPQWVGRARTSWSNVRTLSFSSASSGIGLSFVPMDRADRDHSGLRGGDLARDDRLQAQHGGSGHHDGIDAGLRHRAVRAAAEEPDLEAVGGGLRCPGAVGDVACGPGHDA